MRVVVCTLLVVLLAGVALTPAFAQDNMGYAPMAKAKFGNLPVLPRCGSIAVASGDPNKEAAVILAKVATGCVIPWHWHSANEQLMGVSGTGKAAMKDGKPVTVHGGDYLSLPAKQAHQFTCLSACTLFIVSDAPFDIHYVDAKGDEITPEQALKSGKKAGAHKKPAAKQGD